MKQLLITGFDPFGGASVNPAWEAVKALPDEIGAYAVTKQQIPTIFGCAAEAVLNAADRMTSPPDVILCIGQAGGRAAVTPEFAAINYRHASIPDNAGCIIQDSPVIPGAPAAYFATVPVHAMTAAIQAVGLCAKTSYSAGTFVCNDVLYSLLHRFSGTAVRVGFIHVPFLPEQVSDAAAPSMSLADMVRALTAAVTALP
ncbi:MAG: pyroglutamyl-peptidase I [Ruminococcaceae bacterium]|nr:pyroglutamyl-peptidase I [Oscillospiraceae bacterium]